MNEMEIQKRLRRFTYSLLLFGMVLLIGSGFVSETLVSMFQKEIDRNIRTEAEHCLLSINRRINTDLQTLFTITDILEFSDFGNKERLIEGIEASIERNDFLQMAYFGLGGNGVRVTAGREAEEIRAEDTDPLLYEAIQAAWEGEFDVTKAYYSEHLQKEAIAYAVPVRDRGKIQGAMVVCNDTESLLNALIQSVDMERNSYDLGILNDQGEFVLFSGETHPEAIGYSLYDSSVLNNADRNALTMAIGQKKSTFLTIRHGGEEYRAFAEPTELGEWYLILITAHGGENTLSYRNMVLTKGVFFVSTAVLILYILYGSALLRKSNKELLRLAYYDPLTGAGNMVKFSRQLEKVLQETKEFSIVAMNIRKFKVINEVFGETAADRLLCQIKEILEDSMGQEEFFCRESADQFYLLLQTVEEDVVRRRLMEIGQKIQKAFLAQHSKYRLLLYAGVVTGNGVESTELHQEEIITHVMFALNHARENPQENICFSNGELHRQELMRSYIESHMEQALKNGEFRLFLQPKIDLKTGELNGAEALVRWITAKGELLFPNQFIPEFEKNGFCTELDLYMVEQACQQICRWRENGQRVVPISVNQSKLLFYKQEYVEQLMEIISRYQVPAEMITLEILESLALVDEEGLNIRIHELKAKGFRISMDDFGNGYSSLNTLSGLDIDELKLDRAFLMEMPEERKWKQKVVMEQLFALARKLHISTVAEGVETKEDEILIRQAGCDLGQGYFYSRPLDAASFTERFMQKQEESKKE